MNKRELKEVLAKENISEEFYSLEGGFPYDKYCLFFNGEIWEVYYSERGEKISLKVFDSEEVACDYFHAWLLESLKRNKIL